MSTPAHSGACLCGSVRYEVAGPLRDVVLCHCRRCRRSHGHVAAYTACAASDLTIVETEWLRWYQADGRRRGFCARCGASLFWRAADRPTISISAGTLTEPTGLRTVAQIYTASPGDYYRLPDEGDRYPESLPPE